MRTFCHWITKNWGPLGIDTFLGLALSAASGIFKWMYPSRADLTEKRQRTRDKQLDERVLAALCDLQMDRQSRGTTGGGFPLSRVSEIAFHFQEDRNAVYESLLRLHQRRRVSSNHEFWLPLPD